MVLKFCPAMPSQGRAPWTRIPFLLQLHLIALLSLKLDIGSRSIRLFPIQRLPVLDTSAHEFRPRRNGEGRCHALRHQLPKLWMMPAEIIPAAVAVPPDSGAQPLDLINQLVARQHIQIFVHEQ